MRISAKQTQRFSFALVILAVALLAFSGPLYRMGILSLPSAFSGFRLACWAALGAMILWSLSLIQSQGNRSFLQATGLLLALGVLGTGLYWRLRASHYPMIHDISTDTEHPPLFSAILPLRANSPNSSNYGGPGIAALQHLAYPEIAPLKLNGVGAPDAFSRALDAAKTMGWEIVASDPSNGRIEATDTTFWFGFKDDVVVRVTRLVAPENGSQIDVRSVSRVGLSDLGKNAHRIDSYLRLLKPKS
jgi:uncharacterized protein (DUF1499 family)